MTRPVNWYFVFTRETIASGFPPHVGFVLAALAMASHDAHLCAVDDFAHLVAFHGSSDHHLGFPAAVWVQVVAQREAGGDISVRYPL